MKFNLTIARSVVLVVIAVTLLMLPVSKIPYLDQKADTYFSEAITKAGVAYGVCRIINASVSVIKESQVHIEPVGLGVSVAAGQVFDPLDDMTERASDILVTAIVSLGIQKIAYELSIAFAPILIAILLITFVLSSISKGERAKSLKALIFKSIVLIAVLRLCLPTSAIISTYLDNSYFSPEITKAKDELSMKTPAVERLKNIHLPEIDGLKTIDNSVEFVKKGSSDLKTATREILRNMGNMISNLLKLSYLYVALFVIQVILLPIGIFWFLSRATNALFGTNIPVIISHKGSSITRPDNQAKEPSV